MGRKDVAFNISVEVAVVEIAIFKILVPSLSWYLCLIFFCQGLNMDERLHLLENRVSFCERKQELLQIELIVISTKGKDSKFGLLWNWYFSVFTISPDYLKPLSILELEDTFQAPNMRNFLSLANDCQGLFQIIKSFHELVFWILSFDSFGLQLLADQLRVY